MNALRFSLILTATATREAPFIHLCNTLESSYNAVSIQSKLAEKFIGHLRDLICRRNNFAADSMHVLNRLLRPSFRRSPLSSISY